MKIKLFAGAGAAILIAGAFTAGSLTTASATGQKAAFAAPASSTASSSVSIAPGSFATARATCPAGKIISGGGSYSSSFSVVTISSYPFGDDAWIVGVRNNGTTATSMTVYAVCLGLA
jgi:hypothetical protein